MDNNRSVGYYEDLIAELDLKLLELLSHIKLLANSTGTINDYKIEPQDINAISTTLYDKTLAVMFVEQKLKISLNNIKV